MIGGYAGKLLFIDLINREIKEENIDDNLARNFLGGYGIRSRIIYERTKPIINPLGEDNIFGILTGPLTGAMNAFTSRYTVVGKSPLTDSWGDANGSGYFGPNLKFSGYDGIFFSGISDKPVYLLIEDGEVTICDATNIWGKDTYATEEIMKSKYGKKAEVACIGIAGEKLCRFAAVVTAKGRCAGRSGLGAVMGSKKIKAIVVVGSKHIQVANPELVKEIRKKYTRQLKENLKTVDGFSYSEFYRSTGTPGYIREGALSGDSPVKNWYGVGLKDLGDTSEIKYENIKKYRTGSRKSCYRCSMGCWGHVMIEKGQYALEEPAHIPEYETGAAFGSYCLNTNFESIVKCNDICNRAGIDTISTGASIAFAMNCYEDGIITNKDTDGIELTWGNHESIVKITEKIIKREGIGDILAEGTMRASKIIGSGSEKYAIHVGGQELPAHDSRLEPSMASIYKNNPTPGRHTQDSEFTPPPKLEELLPDIDFSYSFGRKRDKYTGRAKAQKVCSVLNHCVNSSGICLCGYLSVEASFMPESISAVTGWDVDLDELLITGERIGNMRLAFAVREGINPVNFNYPDIALGRPPLKEGPNKNVTVDLERLTRDYCNEMNWDLETSRPSKAKLKELGLEWLIKDLWD